MRDAHITFLLCGFRRVIRRFARNEFEHGSIERGRSIFEGLMASYPKRLDLWNVYLDKEIKMGEIRAARNLLERLVSTLQNRRLYIWGGFTEKFC